MSGGCNLLNGAISGVKQFGNAAGNFFKDDVGGFFVNDVGGFFKNLGRKKRDIDCSLDAMKVPGLDVDVQGLNVEAPDLSQLLEFAKRLRPDMNFVDFDLNLENLKTLFQSQSIADIREKLMKVVKYIFKHVQALFSKCKKFFYFATLIFVIYDGYK